MVELTLKILIAGFRRRGRLLNPKIVVLELTYKCNIKCIHCSVNYNYIDSDLSSSEWISILHKLKQEGTEKIILSGGEPLLYKGFWEVLDYATKNFKNVGITSNGIAILNQDIIKNLKRFNAKEVQISIDGLKEQHDYIRGKGNFEKSIEAIKLLKENNFKVYTMTVLSIKNYEYLEEIVETLSSFNVDRMGFERFTPTGRGTELDIALSSKELKLCFNEYLKLKKKYSLNFNDPFFSVKECEDFSNLFFATNGCLAGIQNFAISNRGELKLCTRLPHTLGKVLDIDLNKIIKQNRIANDLFYRKLEGKCSSCKYIYNCGGCRAEAL